MALSDIRIRFRRLCWVGCGMVILASGCFSPKKPAGESAGDAVASESGVTADEATPRETVNKKTQNVLNLAEALASGGELASGEVAATNPLLQSADAYRTSVAKLGAMAISQAIQIRNAQSIQDPKPLAYVVFMAEIIKPGQPDGIQLAMLPYYQEYAWDETAQELVVVNFPARIAEREKRR